MNSLEALNKLADESRPKENYLSALFSGPTGTGKTHLTLTAPRPCVTLYCDRSGGDEDLVEEKNGVFRIYIRRGQVVRDTRSYLDRIACGDLSKEGIQTVCLDSLTYLQSLVKADAVPERKQVSQKKWGNCASDIEWILQSFFTLQQHRIIFAHLKSEKYLTEVDGQNVQKTVWMPDAMPVVRKITQREVDLMGYTWRKTVKKEGTDEVEDLFGINFTETVKSRGLVFEFQDAKAPAGWGNEVPDITALIAKRWPAKTLEASKKGVANAQA